jgi:hypothetical protein
LRASRRGDQRRLHRRLDADPTIAIHCGHPRDARLDADEFARLSTDTARRNHHTRWPPLRLWPHAIYPTMFELRDVEVISYRNEDDGLIAASLSFDHPVAPVHGPWAALAPGPGRPTGVWFDHFGRLIRRSIEAGRPVVIGGKGHTPLKRELGFRSEPQWTVLRRLSRA